MDLLVVSFSFSLLFYISSIMDTCSESDQLPTPNSNNNLFWFFYTALPFITNHLIRIVVVCAMKMYDVVPLKSLVMPLLQFVFTASQKLLGFGK